MLLDWLRQLRKGPMAPPTPRVRLEVARFGIGFCPGCRRLRGVTSPSCQHCGSRAAVTEDA